MKSFKFKLNYDELPEIKRRVPIDSEPGLMFEGKEEDDRKIPTLRSVFEAFPEVGINIDVKSCDARLVAAVDRLVRQCEREDSTVWGSFAHETCALCERANPRVGLLFSFRRVIQTLGLFYAGLLPFVDVPETHFEIPMISSFKAVSLGQLGLTKPPRSAFGNFVAGALDAILMRYVGVQGCLQMNMFANVSLFSRPWMFRHLRARGIEVYLWVLNSDKEFDKALRQVYKTEQISLRPGCAIFMQQNGSRLYRVTSLVANLGWVDLDLGSSPGWWPLL